MTVAIILALILTAGVLLAAYALWLESQPADRLSRAVRRQMRRSARIGWGAYAVGSAVHLVPDDTIHDADLDCCCAPRCIRYERLDGSTGSMYLHHHDRETAASG